MRILTVIGALAVIVAIGAAVFFLRRLLSAWPAPQEEPAIVHWALVQVRTASINRHANDTPPTTIDNPATIQAGARAVRRTRLHQLPRRAGRGLGQVLGRAAARSARPQGSRERSHAGAIVLGDQERHQHDRHAELRARRRQGRGHLVDRGVPEEIADRQRSRLQGLDRAAATTRACARSISPPAAAPAPDASAPPAAK